MNLSAQKEPAQESSCEIRGGDYDKAGLASRSLKEQLKKIGVAPEILRRVMIAAYEAEMNVVIHARRGVMSFSIASAETALPDDSQVHVEVIDEGPGIADINQAMAEGYSTAPAEARELGFGAGLGLPNIRKNSDRFSIESSVGQGTRVCFTVHLRPQESAGGVPAKRPNSLRVEAARCTQCLRCVHACPTRAVRVRQSRPEILEHLCVDCTRCMSVCAAGALAIREGADSLEPSSDNVLVIPPAFLAIFAPAFSGEQVLSAVRKLGFTHVILTECAERSQRAAVLEYAESQPDAAWPILNGACPAVLNLIETKFPSLIKYVAPLLSPMEAVRESLSGHRATFVALCPAQQTVVGVGGGPDKADIILPSLLESKIRPFLKTPRALVEPLAAPEADDPRIIRVTGMSHVVRVLEEVENGLLTDRCVLELHACDEGCFGSPLLREDPFMSRRHYRTPAEALPQVSAMSRKVPLAGRPGLRLDSSMPRAIQKLAQIDQLLRTLPGSNCGVCGCPTCAALAEDVVLGRTSLSACRRLGEKQP